MLPTESVCTRTNQKKECKKEMQIKESNKYEIMLSHTMKKMLPKKKKPLPQEKHQYTRILFLVILKFILLKNKT